MSKIYIMMGLPASGKSTRAQDILLRDGNAVRINKDLLRTMLHFDKFTGKAERKTRDAARALVKTFLSQGVNVIIDDTNLNPKTMQSWKDIAKEMSAKCEVVDMTDVSVIECVLRDRARDNQVGDTVIKNMALRYALTPPPKKGYVLCDIDGTIADTTNRLHYVRRPEGEKKDWKGFFSGISNDPVREDTRALLIDLYNQGYVIVFLSARPDTYQNDTIGWLSNHLLSFAYTVIMRPAWDKRPDTEVKRDMLNQYFPDKSQIHLVIDDRPSIIRLWREMGLNVLDVGKGVEF